MDNSLLASKLIGEVITVAFNFQSQMTLDETLSVPLVTVSLYSGFDFNPQDIKLGAASVSGVEVTQKIQLGITGVIYILTATATGSTGAEYACVKYLAILSDVSGYPPANLPELTGVLPSAVTGILYSNNLQITGGFPPYSFDDIISGDAPDWMGFTVVDDQLVCAGMPDDITTVHYVFTPQIRDSALNPADEPQDMYNVPAGFVPTLTGAAPDGSYGSAYAGYTYGGTSPNGTFTVTLLSGTLPPDVTINSAGTLSTDITTSVGNYTYTIRKTDVLGLYVDLVDTIQVYLPMILYATRNVGVNVDIIPSIDGRDWSAPPIATNLTDPDVGYSINLIGLPGRYWGKGIASATPAAYSDNFGVNWTQTVDNVIRGVGMTYTNDTLLLGAHTGNFLMSTDRGETFSFGPNAARYIIALDSESGDVAAVVGSNLSASGDTGNSWFGGVPHGVFLASGGISGTDGNYYYLGGSITFNSAPKLVRYDGAAVVDIVLPALTNPSIILAFAYGNNTKVIGTNVGQIAFDTGGGFQIATTALVGAITQLFWNGSVFIAVQEVTAGANGSIYYSTDGDVWVHAPTYLPMNPKSVCQAVAL